MAIDKHNALRDLQADEDADQDFVKAQQEEINADWKDRRVHHSDVSSNHDSPDHSQTNQIRQGLLGWMAALNGSAHVFVMAYMANRTVIAFVPQLTYRISQPNQFPNFSFSFLYIGIRPHVFLLAFFGPLLSVGFCRCRLLKVWTLNVRPERPHAAEKCFLMVALDWLGLLGPRARAGVRLLLGQS